MTGIHDDGLLDDDELDEASGAEDWLIMGPSDAEMLELLDDEEIDDGTAVYLHGIGHEIEDEQPDK